jgi:acetyl/propionyl-CoA carboxylase alpha subunit
MANFDAKVHGDNDIHTRILDFFVAEFENSNLTKFNILLAIDTLIEHVWSIKYTTQLDPKKRNEIVGSIREELYHYQAFFSTLAVLIDPKNYDKFFSTSGTHTDRMISSEQWWLSYDKIQIEKFLREIFDSIDPKNTHSSYETWKQSHFSWLSKTMTDQREVMIDLTKKFKQVHYDLPDTIISLALLLEEKFIESIFDTEYSSILLSSDTLPIDFHAKAIYEQIRLYEWLRTQIFGKRGTEEIQRKFLSSYTELYNLFERAHTTALQDPKKLRDKPQSAVSVGWGRIGYNLEKSTWIERREINQKFGVIMLDFSVEWGAIDGSAAANIIQLIEQATRDEQPIIMYLQSAGMYVDGWPEAVSSMTAINFAIAEYFRKTEGNPKCKIFSVPFGVCTGGTIASFAQAPWVIILPLSLSDIPFAGRIVTMDQLPLTATLADLQIGKWKIAWIASNPFISESTVNSIYEKLRARWIAVEVPEKDLLAYIAEYLTVPLNNPLSVSESNVVREYQNTQLFRPYKKVAILNRGVIASKAIGILENMKKPYLAFATAADKDLSYIQKALKKWNATFVNDYMMSELAIIQAIKDGGCDAVYLGYGFWSERDSFISMCQEHGIVVIWPSASNVKQMWDKIQARTTFKSVLAKVEPSEVERIKYAPARGSDDVLGGEGIIDNTEQAIQVANQIGYPVMIKAVYGWGGKWIRKVSSDQDLYDTFDLMSREATESFWNGAMYMEKALENQRHIEVQIFADIHGNAVSLGVRDCTTQRNRQKIIEETGELGIEQHLLTRLQDIAVAVVRQIGYVGAGTFEFLYDPEKQVFTFMEMNTRIQVEHTITEKYLRDTLDNDISLVGLQFQVSQWWTDKLMDQKHREKLSNAIQEKKKHVMEVRICAEDPANSFAWVSMAKIKNWSLNLPRSLKKYVQFETFLSHSTWVNHTSKYDSMIWQLIVTGSSREQARINMIETLKSLKIEWIPTNQEFALRILESDDFRDRTLRIDSMDSKPDRFFGNLKPFTDKIESISELREDSVVLEEGEYVVRMNQDAKITLVPSVGKVFNIPGVDSLFELTMSKVNTVISAKEILGDRFYIKDHTWSTSTLSEWKYELVERIVIDPKNYSRGKAVLVIRPI